MLEVDNEKMALFGMKVWGVIFLDSELSLIVVPGHHVAKKEQSASITKFEKKVKSRESHLSVANVLWTALFGWWVALLFVLVGVFCYLTYVAREYGRISFSLARYIFFPFGIYLIELKVVLVSSHFCLLL